MADGPISFSHALVTLYPQEDGTLQAIPEMQPDAMAGTGACQLRIMAVVARKIGFVELLKEIASGSKHSLPWLWPLSSPDKWCIDLDAARSWIRNGSFSPAGGRVIVKPNYDFDFDLKPSGDFTIRTTVKFSYPATEEEGDDMAAFPELDPWLDAFRTEHPDPRKCAFVMMRFSKTPAHEAIFKAIEDCCASHGIKAMRADQHAFSEDVLANIQTYIHGTGFGIAVFERLEKEYFNPNVSLELGYMMGQKRHVCLLKDKNLDALHTDVVGRIYRTFDTQDAKTTITKELEAWLKEKKFV